MEVPCLFAILMKVATKATKSFLPLNWSGVIPPGVATSAVFNNKRVEPLEPVLGA